MDKIIKENTTFVEDYEMKAIPDTIKKGDEISFERDGLVWNGEVLKTYKKDGKVYGADIYTF